MIAPQKGWTAKDFRDAAAINPLPNDHKGPKNHHTNEPARHELYLLAVGEKKVTEEPDTSKSFYKPSMFLAVFVAANELVLSSTLKPVSLLRDQHQRPSYLASQC